MSSSVEQNKMEHQVVIMQCPHDPKFYCKNWDGEVKMADREKELRQCKLFPTSCGYAVKAKKVELFQAVPGWKRE